jgi:Fe-S cluster assembly protein SufD
VLPIAAVPDDGPPWLRARRSATAERLEGAALPTFEEEVWRYSLIDELDLGAYTPARRPGPADAGAAGWSGPVAAVVTCLDGVPVAVTVDESSASKGLVVSAASSVDEALSAPSAHTTDVFAELNIAYGLDPLVIATRPGLDVEAPVVVLHTTSAAGLATFPRTVVRVAENSSLSVIELAADDAGAALVVPVTELDVAASGRLSYTNLQDHDRHVWQIASLVAEVAQQGTLIAALGGFGGRYARLRTDCRLAGRGATGNLLAAYFANEHQVLDFRTFQDHVAADTSSDLLFKGAVDHASRSVYTGLIRVGKDARGTTAFQTNRNIKLSEDAWAESVPNLEIENNDVRCSHASTVGPVEPDHRFYLESRGVPTAAAERLLVAGFFDEVIRRLPEPSAAAWMRAVVTAKVAAASTGKGEDQ